MARYYPALDCAFYSKNFVEVKNDPNFKYLLNRGIIVRYSKTVPDHNDLSHIYQPLPNSSGSGRGEFSKTQQYREIFVSNKNREIETFVFDFKNIVKNYQVDAFEIAGITVAILGGEFLGIFIALSGVLYHAIRAGMVNVSEDVAYLFVYFEFKLKTNRNVSKQVLAALYNEFFNEIKLAENSEIGSFETIFSKMLKCHLIRKISHDEYFVSKTIGLGLERRAIKDNLRTI